MRTRRRIDIRQRAVLQQNNHYYLGLLGHAFWKQQQAIKSYTNHREKENLDTMHGLVQRVDGEPLR